MKKYNFSFMSGGLLLKESISIANEYLKNKDWEKTREKALEENLLQSRTKSTSVRFLNEVIKRLKQLNKRQIELLASSSSQDQCVLLWFAICNAYEYVKDFSIEVIHEKFLRMELEFTKSDYYKFFNSKLDWHPELEKLSNTSKYKVMQIIFKMLQEANLMESNNLINPILFSSKIANELLKEPTFDHAIFPVNLQSLKDLEN